MQIKDEKENRKKIGTVCMFLGAFFLLSGLVFFILLNWINIYAKKVDATILNSIEMTTSEGKQMKSLEVMYKVGNNMVTTYYTYEGELQEGEVFIQVYYDARNPKVIVKAGWDFEPVFIAVLGLGILLVGLYYRGITDFGIVERKKPDASASEHAKKTYEVKEKIGNGLMMTAGPLVIVAFGLYMVLAKHNPWMWFLVGFGALGVLYFSLIWGPALLELRMLKMAKKFRGTVVEKEEEKIEEKDSEKKDSEEKDSEENDSEEEALSEEKAEDTSEPEGNKDSSGEKKEKSKGNKK